MHAGVLVHADAVLDPRADFKTATAAWLIEREKYLVGMSASERARRRFNRPEL